MLRGGEIRCLLLIYPHSMELSGKVKVSPRQAPGHQDAIQWRTETSHLFRALHLEDWTHLDTLVIKCQNRTQASRGWDHCAASSAKPYCTRSRNCIAGRKSITPWKSIHPSYSSKQSDLQKELPASAVAWTANLGNWTHGDTAGLGFQLRIFLPVPVLFLCTT